MKTTVSRWGNSLAVRLPADIVRQYGLSAGEVLELTSRPDAIEISKSKGERRYFKGIPIYPMEELLAGMDPANEPETIDWGPDRGSEIIDDEYSRGEITYEDLVGDRPAESR